MTILSSTGVYALGERLADMTAPLFTLKRGHLHEALARGCGFRNKAALTARAKFDPEWGITAFDHAAFKVRLGELTNNPDTAGAVDFFVQGGTIDIRIDKLPESFGASETVYAVTVRVGGIDLRTIKAAPYFFLPQFISHGRELYRLDSAAKYRVDTYPYEMTHTGNAYRGLRSAELIDGVWQGGLYIYDAQHRLDDHRCLRSIRAALARAILPQFTHGVRCKIFKPDRYDYGAWRVEASLGPSAAAYVGAEFGFDLPHLPGRLWICDDGYGVASHKAKMIDGVWLGDLYSNGIHEDHNPVSVTRMRACLEAALDARLKDAGWVVDSLPVLQ